MITENTTLLAAGVKLGSKVADIIQGRADILALTQATQEALLHPRVAGGISYVERTAIACRIARLNHDDVLAEHYTTRPQHEPDATLRAQIANPSWTGAGDRRLTALLRHVDLVTQMPQQATQADIIALRDAGLAEADIVRLAELIAFINYQSRVIAGLRLLGDLT